MSRPPDRGDVGSSIFGDEEERPEIPEEEKPKEEEREEKKHERRGPLHFLRELPGLVLIALVLALLIKSFLVQAFFIPSQSMDPTLEVGDRVLVNKMIYRIRDPHRSEVIVFVNPDLVEPDRNPLAAAWHWITEGLGLSTDPEKDFIKRVIALPGETVELKQGHVFVDGDMLEEPYADLDGSDYDPFKVPPDTLFVMGDNRGNSQDSRSFGPIPRDKVVGKAFVLVWPPSRAGWLSGG